MSELEEKDHPLQEQDSDFEDEFTNSQADLGVDTEPMFPISGHFQSSCVNLSQQSDVEEPEIVEAGMLVEESDIWKSNSHDKSASLAPTSSPTKSSISWSSHNNDQMDSWSSDKEADNAGDKRSVVTEEQLACVVVQWTMEENNVISAELKQMSLLENPDGVFGGEKPGRTSIMSSNSLKSSSSSGSVGLAGPFPLPGHERQSIMCSISSSTSSSTKSHPSWDGPFLKSTLPGSRTSCSCGYCGHVIPPLEKISPVMVGNAKLTKKEKLKVKPAIRKRLKKEINSCQINEENEEEISSSGNQPQITIKNPPNKPRRQYKKTFNKETPVTPDKAKADCGFVHASARITHSTPEPPKHKSNGDPVFARWADGRYYSGWVTQLPVELAPTQVLVHFCDGQRKQTPISKVIRADVITAGTLVLVTTDTGDYEEALVVQANKDGPEPEFQVERDCVTRKVQFSNIALLESQVLDLMTQVQKNASTLNFNDLSLENILSHPRKRSARTRFADMSPVSSNVKKKKRPTTPEPSTSHGQTFGGPENYYMDTDSSTHSVCSVDLRGKEVKPLDAECSPPELEEESCSKLSSYRRNMTIKSKKRKDEPESIVKLLGPIPKAGSQLFSGYVFMITYTRDVELNRNLHTSAAEDADRSDLGLPVWKERLRTQIKSGGGKVFSNLSQIAKEDLPKTYLITDKPCNTPLYLQCLVNDIPIYHVSLVHKCCTQNRPFKELVVLRSTKKLMAGFSLAKQCLVNPRSLHPLRNKTLLLALSGGPSVSTFWISLITKMGGIPEIYGGRFLVKNRFDVIVTDTDCDQELVTQAYEQEVPLVSLTWLQQCIINGDYRSTTEHPLYKYNTVSNVDSPEY